MTRPTAARHSSSEIDIKAVMLTNSAPDTLWRLRAAKGKTAQVMRPAPVLRLSSLLMVRDAVLAGAGPALLPKMLVADDIAAGRLALWGTQDGPPVEIWALQSSRRLIGAKVRAFLDVIAKAFPNKIFVPQS
jgi:DNA-binding transcriptional LysR family regulator